MTKGKEPKYAITDKNGKPINKPEIIDEAGISAQGVTNAVGWFTIGDHTLVEYGGKLYDPSFGTLNKDGKPFNDVGEWAVASLAGFMRIDRKINPAENAQTRVVEFKALACKLKSGAQVICLPSVGPHTRSAPVYQNHRGAPALHAVTVFRCAISTRCSLSLSFVSGAHCPQWAPEAIDQGRRRKRARFSAMF